MLLKDKKVLPQQIYKKLNKEEYAGAYHKLLFQVGW